MVILGDFARLNSLSLAFRLSWISPVSWVLPIAYFSSLLAAVYDVIPTVLQQCPGTLHLHFKCIEVISKLNSKLFANLISTTCYCDFGDFTLRCSYYAVIHSMSSVSFGAQHFKILSFAVSWGKPRNDWSIIDGFPVHNRFGCFLVSNTGYNIGVCIVFP